MIIYKIENKINGKIYIGKTIKQLSRRIASHIDGHYHIGRALRKYGLQNFDISVIDFVDFGDPVLLSELEMYYIRFYNSKSPNGYNHTDGGDGIVGCKWTKKRKKEQSIKMSGDENPMRRPEVVEKVRLGNMGKKDSPETLERKRKAAPKTKSKEHKKRISDSLMGHNVSDETRKKIRVAHIGMKQSEETIAKKRGVPQSEEANRKRSETMTGKPKSEEWKRKVRKPHVMTSEGIAGITCSNKERDYKPKFMKSEALLAQTIH